MLSVKMLKHSSENGKIEKYANTKKVKQFKIYHFYRVTLFYNLLSGIGGRAVSVRKGNNIVLFMNLK